MAADRSRGYLCKVWGAARLRAGPAALFCQGGKTVAATLVLADDDDDLRAVYAPCLRAAGYTVHEAADGREALDLVREHRPALLLLDIWMPGLNGFEVLDGLRHDPAAGRLKVV